MSNTNGGFNEITKDTSETDDDTERFKPLSHLCNERPIQLSRRKSLILCRHKLQRRIGGRSRRGRQQHKRNWLPDLESEQQLEANLLADDTDPEWAQLQEMEEFLRLQRVEQLRQGVLESDSEDWESPNWPTGGEYITDEEEDDGLEDADLAFITSIRESFSRPKPVMKPNESFRTNFPPEGAQTQADAKLMTPPKFNHNSTIKTSITEKFNYFPTLEEEGTVEFTDTEDTTGVFTTRAYPHNHLINKLSDVEGSNQTRATTREPKTNQSSNEKNSSTHWNIIQANNKALQTQLEQAVARIKWNGLVSAPILESVVLPVLESSDLILDLFIILNLRLAVVLNGSNGF